MRRQAVSVIALLAAAPLVATPLAAQPVLLDEVVLSASRLPQAAKRTGASVSVVMAEDLEKSGAVQLSDHLATLPGVSVVQSGPAGTATSLRLRGAEPHHVAVYIDGIRVDDPSGIATQFDFGSLLAADVGRVEILRGSQGAVWGGSAIGGVVNITSRRAEKQGLSQQAALEAGSYKTLSARYSLAWRSETVETSLNFSHLRSDGFSAQDTLPKTQGREADGIDTTRLSLTTRYKVNEALTFGASIFAQRTRADYDGFTSETGVFEKRREVGGRVFAEYAVGNSEHVFEATSYRITRDQYAPHAVTGIPAFGNGYVGKRIGFSYQGKTEVSSALTLVYGADTQRESVTGASVRISSLFGQALWRASETLDIGVGLRSTHNSDFGSEPSGRISLAWQATPELTLRAVAATGWQAPAMNQLVGYPIYGTAPNAALKPETSRSFEVGADYRLDNGASVTLNLFRIDTDNFIGYCGLPGDPYTNWDCVGALPAGMTNMYENGPGKTRRQGVEISGSVPLAERVTANFAYTYTDVQRAGARSGSVPRHNLALGLDAQLTDRLSGTLGLRHQAGRAGGMPNFSVVNLGLAYEVAPETKVTLRIENLFDKAYQAVPGYGTSGRAFYVGLRKAF